MLVQPCCLVHLTLPPPPLPQPPVSSLGMFVVVILDQTYLADTAAQLLVVDDFLEVEGTKGACMSK